jgi:ADP-dependent NAD(P)H-hydrate dehydratase
VTELPLPNLPPRAPDSHKGDFGRALLVGGSRGMSGAVSLAGMAALRSGAGLVTLAVPDPILEVVAAFEPAYMTVPLACDRAGRIAWSATERVEELADAATSVGCGPGLGRSDPLTRLVQWIYQHVSRPLVVDADGLNALAAASDGLSRPGGPRILTPHPGELRRLVGADHQGATTPQLREHAIRLAAEHQIVVVLKGHQTLITDGTRCSQNQTGNPGMATGGTGDVLTGVITALVGQGLEPFDAARLGAHVHGLAGDLAAAQLGQISMIASDLVNFLPAAFRSLEPHS